MGVTARHILAATVLLAGSTPAAWATLVVSEGALFVGSGVIDDAVVNHGQITGTSHLPLVFGPTSRVSGSGRFENTLSLGTFAPGNSPGVSSGTNQAFGGTIEIELGGATPGSGSGRHDQINDSGTIELAGMPTLSILSFEGYVPVAHVDEFEVLTWETGLVGSFGSVLVDSTFTDANIGFALIFTNPGGEGSLTLRAIPEASVIAIWTALTLGAALCLYLKRPKKTRLAHTGPQSI